jgi:hypothetical protein
MNKGVKRLFIILLLVFMAYLPGLPYGEDGNILKGPVKLARGDSPVADPPVKSPRRVPEAEKGRKRPPDPGEKRQQQGRSTGSGAGAKEPFIKDFVPSEEIAAGQAVDFPADI